jgi:tetratricopeptide (TPR) repeat protein
VWQELRNELHGQGLEIVTVALDVTVEAAHKIIDRVSPSHPALIDQQHAVDALFGIVNVPAGVWIDEEGIIVRPPEPAFPGRAVYRDMPVPDTLPQRLRDMLAEAAKIRAEPEKYVSALRAWVSEGKNSRFALSPDEVVERSRPRPWEEALAAAHFELGAHLHRVGRIDEAARHWREAHRLQPENWTYKRQAWSLADPLQGPTELYQGDWLSEVRRTGPENYYAPLKM